MPAMMSRISTSGAEVRLGEHPSLAAPGAGDPHKPRRERPERFVQGFATGWQWLVAVAAPVTGAGSGERSFQDAGGAMIRRPDHARQKRLTLSGVPAP
jgi:hypothetical protein